LRSKVSQAKKKKSKTLTEKYLKTKSFGGKAQEVECLPSKREALI
jgi:hypothetical protein